MRENKTAPNSTRPRNGMPKNSDRFGEGGATPSKRKNPYAFISQYCPHCGYVHMFKRGRCLSCNKRLMDMGPEIHPKERRCRKRKEKVNQVKGSSEGVLYGPLFEQGKDTI